MRVEIAYEMTDELARAGNRLLVEREMRGLTWRGPLLWLAISLAVLAVVVWLQAHWLFYFLAAFPVAIFLLALIVVLVLPVLYRVRLKRYLKQLAAWPNRQVVIALTPDVIELTTPVAGGLMERGDLSALLESPEVTVLLLARKILVPIPTASIPEAAWALLRTQQPTPVETPPVDQGANDGSRPERPAAHHQ